MNLELFISKRISGKDKNETGISDSTIRIVVIAVALSVAIMILAISIVTGFKQKIREKIIGFGAHISITNQSTNTTYETFPVNKNQEFCSELKKMPEIKHVQVFAYKPGIIKTKTDIQGIVLKGIDKDFDWNFFENNMVEGKKFTVADSVKTNDIVISRTLAKLLRLKLGDPVNMVFIQNPPRLRKYSVKGIYYTGLEEYDKLFVLADIKDVQKLNEWDSTQISGFEILTNDFENIENITKKINPYVAVQFQKDSTKLQITNIKESNPAIFEWLNITDVNVWAILVLMTFIAVINMITGLLIIILERSTMIGVLKSLGATNWVVRKIFIYNSIYIIGKGLLYGNIVGISLCLIQMHLGIIKLDPTSYYMDTVPINLNFIYILLLNISTIIITSISMIVPSVIITRMEPVKAIRLD